MWTGVGPAGDGGSTRSDAALSRAARALASTPGRQFSLQDMWAALRYAPASGIATALMAACSERDSAE